MDLNDLLTNSVLLLKKEEIGSIIGPEAEQFKELVSLAFSRDMPVCWRATWLMDYLAETYPWLAEEYVEQIWSEIPKKHPDGVTRSALRLLCRYPIPEDFQGLATDLCLDWLVQESVPVAIKAYSMELLLNIARIYPELSNEFIAIIEEQVPNGTAGYKARAKHVIAALRKLQV
jgi:hypothetical protein